MTLDDLAERTPIAIGVPGHPARAVAHDSQVTSAKGFKKALVRAMVADPVTRQLSLLHLGVTTGVAFEAIPSSGLTVATAAALGDLAGTGRAD